MEKTTTTTTKNNGGTQAAKMKKLEEENTSLKNEIGDIKALLESMLSNQSNKTEVTTIAPYVSKMDTPCTIVHLVDCAPGLYTTIKVNGFEHLFSKFGEVKSFRFGDMQNIVAKYREWFERGVFVLADDCREFAMELPVEILNKEIKLSDMANLVSMNDEAFENLIGLMSQPQKSQIVRNWAISYKENKNGYKSQSKVAILNKATDGLLKSMLPEAFAS